MYTASTVRGRLTGGDLAPAFKAEGRTTHLDVAAELSRLVKRLVAARGEVEREFGVRGALGASPRRVLGLVAGQGMTLAIGGVVIGVVGAFAVMRVMESLLYGVRTTDPLTFASENRDALTCTHAPSIAWAAGAG